MKDYKITVTDHAEAGVCTSEYRVRYRESNSSAFQEIYPRPQGPDIVIPRLKEGLSYEIQISRICCDANVESPIVQRFITVPTGE